jgi:peptidoglycan/xylan/chitin deacetylase (PgdA/CDA1 family)
MMIRLINALITCLIFSNASYAINCNNSWLYKKLKPLKNKCSQKKVHFTFDDGPDKKNTPKILDLLKKRGVTSTFFVSTTRVADGKPNKILKRMVREGHVLGSHGHHHHAHDLRLLRVGENRYKCDPQILSEKESMRQIKLSFDLLNKATGGSFSKQKNQLFRFPYGRGASPSKVELDQMQRYGQSTRACKYINANRKIYEDPNYKQNLSDYRKYRGKAMQRIHENGRDHVGWNFDSQDSNTKVATKAKKDPLWYKQRTIQKLCESPNKNIMALFHDYAKSFNAESLGDIIDVGRCLGIDFVSYDEILKERDFLVNAGILQEAPRKDNLDTSVKQLFASIENAEPKGCDDCHLHKTATEVVETCLSSTGKKYGQCQGQSSICVDGKWKARSNIPEVGRACPHLYKSCQSSYVPAPVAHCGGSSSICIDGKWFNSDNIEAIIYCK